MTLTRCWSRVLPWACLSFLIFFSSSAVAGIFVDLDQETPVYARPRDDQQPISVFPSGSIVEVSVRLIRGYRRVRTGPGTYGYISEQDLPIIEGEFEGPRDFAVGLSFRTGFLRQGRKQFNVQDGSTYETAGYKGSSFQSILFLDSRVDSSKVFRSYLALQKARYTGTAVQTNAPSTPKAIALDQSLIVLGGEFKFELLNQRHIWAGIGGEYAWGTRLDLYFGGSRLTTEKQDLPRVFTAFVSAGWDYYLGKRWVVCPEMRYSFALSAKPVVFGYGLGLGVGYRY